MIEWVHGADSLVVREIRERAKAIETRIGADFLTYSGPINDGAHALLKDTVESIGKIGKRRRRLMVHLETGGGYIESAERIANTFRHHYQTVMFLVTTYAMSAGTVLVMSGDEIYMDYSATLGPIDPQLQRPNSRQYVPALGYLEQFKRLIDKSANGTLTDAELHYLLRNFDPGELYQYEQARDLSFALLEEWLVKYKFRKWRVTETTKTRVTVAMKKARAAEIATKLNETSRWHSHSRGISMEVARRDLGLQILDIDDDPELRECLLQYNRLLMDYRAKRGDDLFIIVWSGGYHGH